VRRSRAAATVALLAALVLVLGAAYVYGSMQCPPPEWWFQLFLQSGNFGCVV
jgi:hypothetical protein